MIKQKHSWISKYLDKEMELVHYGHYGLVFLMFPATSDDCYEFELNGALDLVQNYVEKGKCSIFSLSSLNFESWLNPEKNEKEKLEIQINYYQYIIEEVLPFIFQECGGPIPIIPTGGGIGAYHSSNLFFKRPDLFYGVVSMSGTYNLEHFTNGYFDEQCYFNSPIHFLPNLTDEYWLSFLRNKDHIYLLTGSGDNEHPENLEDFIGILNNKKIKHNTEFWGREWHHDWTTWKSMLLYILKNKL